MTTDDKAYLVDGTYGICDLVDLAQLRGIFERFTEATGFTIGFLDHPGLNILIGTGWRNICTKFHRECPVAADNCTRSNRHLLDRLDQPGQLMIEACENGLVDCAFPIIVKGKHIASLATGQLLLEKPDLERFKQQARRFGIDEDAYLRALAEVPVVPEEKLRSVTRFLGEIALLLSEMGYARLTAKAEAERLGQEIANRKKAEEALQASGDRVRHLNDVLQSLHAVHSLIATEKDKARLIAGVCESLVRTRGYVTVWIGEPDASSKQVRMVAHAGPGGAILSHAPITWDDGPTGRGPTGTAIRERRPVVFNNLALDPDFAPWRDAVVPLGAGAIASVPLIHRDRMHGVLTVKAERVNAFDAEEVALLNATAADLAHALQSLEDEAARTTLEAQLRQAQKMEAVGRLAGGVAHDFNNLLMGIMGYSELCRDRLEPGNPVRAWIDEITRAAERSAEITRQLLGFARKQTIAPKVLDLNQSVTGLLELLRRLIGEDIGLTWSPGANLRPVSIDPSQVVQILANLCVNARDAIGGIGKITLETGNVTLDKAYCADHAGAVPGEHVVLAVSDDGCGMDKEILAHLFEPFFTTKGVGRGTGLGLATVYGIVKQNNGFIYADSAPGKGTTVRIYLPQAVSEAEETSMPKLSAAPQSRGETILLVEDEKSVRVTCSLSLRALGYEVLVAETPAKALEMSIRNLPDIDLLLTDVVMPGMNGRQLAERLRATKPELKILYMSGYTADIMAQRGILEKGLPFIAKPFSRHELARKLRDVLTNDS